MKQITWPILLLILCINLGKLNAQLPFAISITKTDKNVLLDGIPNESAWQDAKAVSGFNKNFPHADTELKNDTEVRLLYDENNLYISAICYVPEDKKYIIQSLKRDFEFEENDAFAVFIDPYGDNISGWSFMTSSSGVQREGVIEKNGIKGDNASWNGIWKVATSKTSNAWTLEMSIPFTTLRYDKNIANWKINFARNDFNENENEISTWAPVPQGNDVATLVCLGNLEWDEAPQSKISGSVSPYALLRVDRNYEEVGSETKVSPNFGADAKITFSSSLNLDITINPDFSQVDVDKQVLNLDRFEISFPEQRPFFLENSHLFQDLGNSRVSPFFSRRIGSSSDTIIPILAGLKLSGIIGKKWKVSVLDVQTAKVDNVDDSQNHFIATLWRTVGKGSSIRSFFTNRQAFEGFKFRKDDYNRTGGVEYNYISSAGYWTAHGYLHYARTQERLKDAFAFGVKGRYNKKSINIFAGIDAVGENYITDMGFVPRLYFQNEEDEWVRKNYIQYRFNGNYWFFTEEHPIVQRTGPHFNFDVFTSKELNYQEHEFEIGWLVRMNNKSKIDLMYNQSNPILFYEFQLSGLDSTFLPGNYPQHQFIATYSTAKNKIFSSDFEIAYGSRFLGKQFSFESDMNFRFNEKFSLGLFFSQRNLFDFPEEYGVGSLTLLSPKVEFSFTDKIFWTTFLQYNTQKSNFNINSRFQWRFQPMSDIFFVVTNNYDTDIIFQGESIRNWSAVLKINYWIDADTIKSWKKKNKSKL